MPGRTLRPGGHHEPVNDEELAVSYRSALCLRGSSELEDNMARACASLPPHMQERAAALWEGALFAEATPGRPSLGKGVSPRISYRVPGRLYSKAKARARTEGRTLSEVARDALERYVSE